MTKSSSPPSSPLRDTPDERFFDPAVGIEAMGSDESFQLILETVLESMSSSLPEIRQALDTGDVATANSLLHAIKGYVPLMCTERVVELVNHVERVSKTTSIEVVLPLYAELEPILKRLLVDIQAHIDGN